MTGVNEKSLYWECFIYILGAMGNYMYLWVAPGWKSLSHTKHLICLPALSLYGPILYPSTLQDREGLCEGGNTAPVSKTQAPLNGTAGVWR